MAPCLRQARRDAGMAQVAVARALSKPASYPSKRELEELRVDFVELVELARLFGKPLGSFTDPIDLAGGSTVRRRSRRIRYFHDLSSRARVPPSGEASQFPTRSPPAPLDQRHATRSGASLLIRRHPAHRTDDGSAPVPEAPKHHLREHRGPSPNVVAVNAVLEDLDCLDAAAGEGHGQVLNGAMATLQQGFKFLGGPIRCVWHFCSPSPVRRLAAEDLVTRSSDCLSSLARFQRSSEARRARPSGPCPRTEVPAFSLSDRLVDGP